MASTVANDDAEPGKGRLETLTDGVFAIAMTILVFGLHIQQFAGVVSAPQLTTALLKQWPGLAAFALSFVVLGQFWVSMHGQFRLIRRADRWLIWLNVTYLLFISLVPFTADHLGRYGAISPVAVLYGLNLLALSVLQFTMWSWATRRRHLVATDLPSSLVERGRRLGLLSTGGYAVAVVMGLVAPGISVAIFALMSILSITRLDHRLVARRQRGGAASSASD